MLQQTQVNTVISYYEKFMKQFPDIQVLARAKEDAVLHLWTGLGYYARARNLHKAAKIIVEEYRGEFPSDIEKIKRLPGIGRSTAGAISSIAFKKSAPILDGNVKRVLCRFHALIYRGNEEKLWTIAEAYTPRARVEKYTQAMMDLGSLICTRTQPKCESCPLHKNCQSYQQGNPLDFPGKKLSKKLPVKKIMVLILKNKSGQILIEKRPSAGIWGGLWSLPEFSNKKEILNAYKNIHQLKKQPAFRHTFSHYHLDIQPMEAQVEKFEGRGFDPCNPSKLGFAAPIKKILLNT